MSRPSSMKSSNVLCYNISKLSYLLTVRFIFTFYIIIGATFQS